MVLQLFVNGPPGSGKTTLSKLLCKEFNLEHVATGELLRENIKAQTTSGRRAQRCIAAKKLVLDRVVLDMVKAKVTDCIARGRSGWVLDSFPRTPDQAEALMAKQFLCPSIVLLLDLPEVNCIARISGRCFDPVTGAIFHSPHNLPRDPIVCARLTRRRDDTSDRLAPRFEAYRTYGEATNELFANSQIMVHRIDASKTSDAIVEDVAVLLHSLAEKPRRSLSLSNNNNNNSSSSTSNNNQVQHFEKTNTKMPFRKIPDTILETSEEDEIGEGLQQYQYDWGDEASTNHNQRESPQKGHLLTESHPSKQKVYTDIRHDEKNRLSSSFMAALPVPVLPPQAESSSNECLPPPPAPAATSVPMLRPLPTPSGRRIKALRGPKEALNSPVQSTVVRESINVRSSSCSSVQSNSSTTSLETAAASVDMDTFKELLLDGFEAVKHGRRGRPHPRLIFTDLDFKRVFWQKAMGAADRVGKGKHARLEQSVVLSDVIQVARGMKTAVLKRSGNVARYECYVSLVTPIRTLDMELPNPQLADFLQRGFDQLLHH